MKLLKYAPLLLVAIFAMTACNNDADVDTEKPEIDLSITDAFPTSCDTIYFDEPFIVKARLTDNVELGTYNIDIHNNFDQHTHSTEFVSCSFDDIKTAVNPFIFIQDYTIPEASPEYTTDISMTLPGSDGVNQYDEGDYHFQITVVDKEGWSILSGLNVKILHR